MGYLTLVGFVEEHSATNIENLKLMAVKFKQKLALKTYEAQEKRKPPNIGQGLSSVEFHVDRW